MTGPDSTQQRPAQPDAAPAEPSAADPAAPFDPARALSWASKRVVVLTGIALIAIQLIWKAYYLRHLYFRQDDYVDLDRARTSPFDWHYLTLVSSGHLYPGLRAIAWVLARISLYDWGLDSAVLLVFLAVACLACLRLLRTLFGDRPAILIALLVYVLCPLTVPDLGWWWAGLESVPFQLAVFLALDAHVRYLRTGRTGQLVAAALSVVLGLLFFEKAALLPLLLLAVTAGFLMGTRSWLAGAAQTLVRHWRAWVTYAALMIAYLVIFIVAFRASHQAPAVPGSLSAAVTFAEILVRKTLLTGALGGPWQWAALTGGLYAIAAPPAIGMWLAAIVAIGVIAVSVARRSIAWRAWAILAGWIVIVDMVPVFVGRLQYGWASVFGAETRYLADAPVVLAICIALAFLPVSGAKLAAAVPTAPAAPAAPAARPRQPATGAALRYAAIGLVGVFIVGSIISVQEYIADTPGASVPIAYIGNANQALARAGPGTNILNDYMPAGMVTGLFEANARQSRVLGDLETPAQARHIRWIASPHGTIDNLQVFTATGQLAPAVVSGVPAVNRGQGFRACWPEKNGQIAVRFARPTTIYDWTLKVSYIWSGGASSVLVEYDGSEEVLSLRHGVQAAYLPVTGAVRGFIVSGFDQGQLCVAGATAGQLVPF
jgi:hypothetical protein